MFTNGITAPIWESIYNSMHNGVIVVDREGTVILINPAGERLLQVDANTWQNKHIRELISYSKLPEVLANEISFIGEKMQIADKICMVNRNPIYKDGELIGAISVIQDISEVEYYRNLMRQMEMIIEASTDGIYVVDRNGITLMVNSAYEAITGFSRDQLIGNHMGWLMEKGFFDQSVSLLVLNEKKRISIIQRINGRKDVIVTGNPVFNDAGEIEMVVTSVRDITYLNEMKHELERARGFSQLQQNRYTVLLDEGDQPILFRSQKMQTIYEQIQQVAPYPTSILLTGPSGAGKEVMANLIHHLSDRKEQPFIKVNCAAIPETLLESELFGYESGAFTGARKEGKIGLLELADKGTLMLDEIGEMPYALQVKLLRVIQEKQVRRVGGGKSRSLDVRIISATNQDLRQLIKEGKFREDLFYRLNVIEVNIPPLQERPEDIDVLVEHYFTYYCRLFRIEKQLSENTRALLRGYHWPGNVRELRNLMENMIVSIPSTIIEPHHLPIHIYDPVRANPTYSLKERVDEFERQIILEAIGMHGSLRKAAQALGCDHSTLVKKIKKWQWASIR